MKRRTVDLVAALDELAVAPLATLLRAGIRGERCDIYRCPVAVWLAQRGFSGAQVYDGQVYWDGVGVILPPSVGQLLRWFDTGDHGSLAAARRSS